LDLPGAGTSALVGRGEAPLGRREAGAGLDGARRHSGAGRRREPALGVAQALPADLGRAISAIPAAGVPSRSLPRHPSRVSRRRRLPACSRRRVPSATWRSNATNADRPARASHGSRRLDLFRAFIGALSSGDRARHSAIAWCCFSMNSSAKNRARATMPTVHTQDLRPCATDGTCVRARGGF
jgi:hypothetical protein